MNKHLFSSVAAAVFALAFFSSPAAGQTIVTNNADSGGGSLRQTVLDAPAGSTITFGDAVRGTISLTNGHIVIGKNLTIAGPGADALTIRNGAGAGTGNNVFAVNFGVGAVVLSGLTISDGYADGGGGISNGGNLTVRNAVIKNNHATVSGAGILSGGTLALVNSIVTGNGESMASPLNGISQGGGINFAGSSLTITDSTISNNGADEGGGIYVDDGGSVSISSSTVSSNYVYAGVGGGIYLRSNAMATLTNCTVSQNSVSTLDNGGNPNEGGGIFVRDASTLTLINSTIANNQIGFTDPVSSPNAAGAGIANGSFTDTGGTVNARNSIIAGNVFTSNAGNTALDFHGTLTSQGYNLIGSNRFTQIVGVTTGNIVGTQAAPISAKLGPLAGNGGPTMTQALLTGSPAINAGNTASAPATDQRGFGRNGTADMGAFEVSSAAPAVQVLSAVSRKTHGSAGTFDVNLPLTGTAGVESRSGGANGNHTIIVTFANNLTSVGSATVSSGSVTSGAIGSDPHQYVINLASVSDAQRVTVSLNNVTDSYAYNSSTVPIAVGLLVADANGDSAVNSGDATITRNRSGQIADATNFRSDYNLDGFINSADATIARARSGQFIPEAPMPSAFRTVAPVDLKVIAKLYSRHREQRPQAEVTLPSLGMPGAGSRDL